MTEEKIEQLNKQIEELEYQINTLKQERLDLCKGIKAYYIIEEYDPEQEITIYHLMGEMYQYDAEKVNEDICGNLIKVTNKDYSLIRDLDKLDKAKSYIPYNYISCSREITNVMNNIRKDLDNNGIYISEYGLFSLEERRN